MGEKFSVWQDHKIEHLEGLGGGGGAQTQSDTEPKMALCDMQHRIGREHLYLSVVIDLAVILSFIAYFIELQCVLSDQRYNCLVQLFLSFYTLKTTASKLQILVPWIVVTIDDRNTPCVLATVFQKLSGKPPVVALPGMQNWISIHARNTLKKTNNQNTHGCSAQVRKSLKSDHSRNMEKHYRLSCFPGVRNTHLRPCPEHVESASRSASKLSCQLQSADHCPFF